MIIRAFILLFAFSFTVAAAELPIGTKRFVLGAPQEATMKEVAADFDVSTVVGQPNTFFLAEKGRRTGQILGGIAFKEGRLTWIQRTWANLSDGEPTDAANAIFAALDSATRSSGGNATITLETTRVPGIEFKTTSFRFKDRTVTVTVTEGDPARGGKQVSVEESIPQ